MIKQVQGRYMLFQTNKMSYSSNNNQQTNKNKHKMSRIQPELYNRSNELKCIEDLYVPYTELFIA